MDKKYDKKISGLEEKVEKLTKERETYKFFAEHDMLTGLYNQTAARKHVEKIIQRSPDNIYALVIFDLDSFKDANDSYGHLFGDLVLEHIAKKLLGNLEKYCVAARIGGDEFLLFFECGESIEGEINRLFETLNCQYQQYRIRVSMGVSIFPKDGKGYSNLFHCADKAMYASKTNGKNKCYFYDDSMKNILPAHLK